MLDVIALLSQLIACPSITPKDAQCQDILKNHLSRMGFTVTDLPSGPVNNFWAKQGKDQPLFVFAGHTDVVTPGDLHTWQFDPFKPTRHEGYLYGRGAQDMKGPLAAMVVATERFLEKYPFHAGSIGFLITSGEEGREFMHGTPHVMEYLAAQQEKITWCVVGEPSSMTHLGDTIRHGRRGSLHAYLTVTGKQGHVAYPQLALNPIHQALPALTELIQTQWDLGNQDFDPTSLQITSITSGTFGENTNVIPETVRLHFNMRNSPLSDDESLKQRVIAVLDKYKLNYDLVWEISGKPFITAQGTLSVAATAAVTSVTGITPDFSTGGGTSDARFIAPTGAQVIELGVVSDRIHQVDERVNMAELEQLVQIYYTLLENLLTPQ